MATIASDNFATIGTADIFDRAPDVSSIGALWKRKSGSLFSGDGAGRVKADATGADASIDVGASDFDLSVDVTFVDVVDRFALAARTQSAFGATDLSRYMVWNLDATQLRFSTFDAAGDRTDIGTYSAGVTFAVGSTYTIRLVLEGTSIKVFVNGAERISVTNSAISSRSHAAIGGIPSPGTPTATRYDNVLVADLAPADATAPTLTSASASATSGTTSSGSVTTNEGNGTLYWLTNTSSTATATAVKAGSSQAVTATGAQSTSSTGLSPGTTYYTHFLHRDAAGNDSAVLSSASFTTPAPDTTAPTFTGSITVGAKTSSTIALTLPTATDNVAVTGYEYRVDGGAWVDNGNSTAVALSGLAALTSYTIDARAYDAAANVSSTLSVTTSTYRAGASAGSIRTATGPQDGNPAGLLYAFCELLPTSDWVSYSIVSGPTPSGGTLDAQPNGAFSYTGPAPATLVIQPEVNGTASGDPITVTLYDQTAELVADNIGAGSAIGGGALEEVPSLSAEGLVFALDLSTGAVTPVSIGWPARGVRAIVSPGGVDPEPVKVFEQYSFDREVYEVDFDAKYLAGLDDTADELQAFAVPATVPAESRVVVGQALDSGVVMFAIGPDVPVGLHEVLVKIGTAGGRTKGVIVQIKVDR